MFSRRPTLQSRGLTRKLISYVKTERHLTACLGRLRKGIVKWIMSTMKGWEFHALQEKKTLVTRTSTMQEGVTKN